MAGVFSTVSLSCATVRAASASAASVTTLPSARAWARIAPFSASSARFSSASMRAASGATPPSGSGAAGCAGFCCFSSAAFAIASSEASSGSPRSLIRMALKSIWFVSLLGLVGVEERGEGENVMPGTAPVRQSATLAIARTLPALSRTGVAERSS